MSSTTSALRFEYHPAATRMSAAERERLLANPGFGRVFTEHMVSAQWAADRGWHDAGLVPYAKLQLDPASLVLHYSQSIFEGLKAFRQADGGVATFRPDRNAARFRASSRRLALPEFPEEAFLEAIDLLLRADHDWVPSAAEHSLYLRPMMFATELTLMVHPSTDVTFLLIASPSGSYFPKGVKPVTVWLSEDFTRAAPGGTGAAKTGGNYAAGLLAQAQAARGGASEVLGQPDRDGLDALGEIGA